MWADMKWNYLLGACVLLLVYSVVAHSPVMAMLGGVALLSTVKVGSVQLVRRFSDQHRQQRS
jgi:hypothetical protein